MSRNRCLELTVLWLFAAVPACASPPASGSSHILALQNRADPEEVRRFACPPGECLTLSMEHQGEDLRCLPLPIDTLVITGHSDCPHSFLGQPPEIIGQALRCWPIGLIVLDTCRGFCAPLIEALLDASVRQGKPAPLIVGALEDLPPQGLYYKPGFYAPGPAQQRAELVTTRSGAPLVRWSLNGQEMTDAQAVVVKMGPNDLEASLVAVHPNLVRVPLGRSGAEVLITVPAYRFRR